MRYRTRVDTWLVAVLGLTTVLPVALGAFGWIHEGVTSPAAWLPIAIAVVAVVGVVAVGVPTYYEVRSDRLVIRSGLLHWDVPLDAISAITPSSSLLSGPAWSLDRLEVRTLRAGRAGSILISPRRPRDFLKEVAVRDTGLIFDGLGVRRAR